MRFASLLLFALACAPVDATPPLLPDFDGSVPPSGGGGGGGGGGDGAIIGDAGALAAASNPQGIFLSGGFVYYTNYATGAADGTVSTVATSGGTPTDLATGLDGPWSITVASGFVFFTLVPVSGTGGAAAVAASGGSVTSIQTATGAYGIVNDGTNIYWSNDNGGALVQFVAIAGGTPKQLLELGGDFLPTGLALSGTDLYMPTSGTQASVLHGVTSGAGNFAPLDTQAPATYADVAISSTNVFATIDDVTPNGAIVSFPRGGGAAATIVTGLNHPQRLALDGTNLYFTDPTGGNIWRVDLTVTPYAATVYASGLNAPLPIAVADALYVGDADAIVRIPKL